MHLVVSTLCDGGQVYHTPDLCLVDNGKTLRCQEVSHPPEDIEGLTYSCRYGIYMVDPVEFLVNSGSWDVDSCKLSDGIAIDSSR